MTNQFHNLKGAKAIIYLRLSKDDKLDESASITNQREILYSFCSANGILMVKEFIDDGWSGGNFNRPDFQRLLSYVEECKVDLVITKDLSRLGRDMIDSSLYAERYFTERGIRFLAINDNFDSFGDNIYAPFQFAMNDVYIRDISRKIKVVLEHKRKAGKYCACPVYGYKKNPDEKDRLVQDENTAPNVRKIMQMAADGYSLCKITEELNKTGAIPPLKYRVLYRDQFSPEGAARMSDTWNNTTVRRIIQNPVYLGYTVLGRTKKISPKSAKKIKLPEEEWAVTPNTHVALVTEEVFTKANKNVADRKHAYESTINDNGGMRQSIFQGLIYCESCGGRMNSGGTVYRNESQSYWYLSCRNIPKRSKTHCEHGARIRYHALVEIVKNELNSLINLSEAQIQRIIEGVQKEFAVSDHNAKIDEQCNTLQRELDDSNKVLEKLYFDQVQGKISEERFESMIASIENKSCETKNKIIELRKNKIVDDPAERYEKFFEIVRDFQTINTLTPDIVNAFIDRIEVGEQSVKGVRKQPVEQRIKIYYKFIGDALSPEAPYKSQNGTYIIN